MKQDVRFATTNLLGEIQTDKIKTLVALIFANIVSVHNARAQFEHIEIKILEL